MADIVEGVNLNGNNRYTLHTGDGVCAIHADGSLGSPLGTNCQTTDNGQIENTVGCGVQSGIANNFGDAFNNNGGGMYVMEWTSSFMKFW
jgi:hypothetical protein